MQVGGAYGACHWSIRRHVRCGADICETIATTRTTIRGVKGEHRHSGNPSVKSKMSSDYRNRWIMAFFRML